MFPLSLMSVFECLYLKAKCSLLSLLWFYLHTNQCLGWSLCTHSCLQHSWSLSNSKVQINNKGNNKKSASTEDRTLDLQFTRLTLYHWAIKAHTSNVSLCALFSKINLMGSGCPWTLVDTFQTLEENWWKKCPQTKKL